MAIGNVLGRVQSDKLLMQVSSVCIENVDTCSHAGVGVPVGSPSGWTGTADFKKDKPVNSAAKQRKSPEGHHDAVPLMAASRGVRNSNRSARGQGATASAGRAANPVDFPNTPSMMRSGNPLERGKGRAFGPSLAIRDEAIGELSNNRHEADYSKTNEYSSDTRHACNEVSSEALRRSDDSGNGQSNYDGQHVFQHDVSFHDGKGTPCPGPGIDVPGGDLAG
jgi:hypothetical protein